MEHWILTIEGRVQGVFYRQSTLQKAHDLKLNGYVTNQSNGDVLVEAEGPVDKLEQLAQWCRQGPPMASVTAVHTRKGSLKGYRDFVVR